MASGEKSPGQGSHRMAKSRQEEVEAHIGTRTLPPKLLFCRAVGKELSVAGGMQMEAGQPCGRGYKGALKI